jgi:RNA polymerase sigma factor (sigma-70 family)
MDSLKSYLNSIKKCPLLTLAQEQDYIDRIKECRNKLIEGNLRLVVKTAFEINEAWKDVEVLDLIQEGNLGLIDAVDRYEVRKGYRFSTFAMHYIKGYMLTHIRSNTGPLKLGTTKAQREIFYNMGAVKDLLEKEGADVDKIAGVYGGDVNDILTMTSNTVCIDDLGENDLIDNNSPESVYLRNEARLNLRRKIIEFRNTLSENEKFIWDSRILEKQFTYNQCLEPLDMKYEMQVQRLEQKVIKKAKEFFAIQDFYDIIG